MKICEICKREFPEDVMIAFSPGGARRTYECPECHDRACNHVDARALARNRRIWATRTYR